MAGVRDGPRDPSTRLRLFRPLGLVFRGLTLLAALGLLALAGLLLAVLYSGSSQSVGISGWSFPGSSVWDPSRNLFGALPPIEGTLLTSLVALLLAVPVAVGVALFLSESCPRKLRAPLVYVVEISAAVPSVVYGFWAVTVLVPFMRETVEPALFRVTGGALCANTPTGSDLLTGSVILAVMALPTIAAVSREALQSVPRIQRESALSLGATRWEATRTAVLGPARSGLVAAILLGLGRALGETMAVLMVVGNVFLQPNSLCAPGVTLASWIAGDFNAAGPLEFSALVELGLILFFVSVSVNIAARLILRQGAKRSAEHGWVGRLRSWRDQRQGQEAQGSSSPTRRRPKPPLTSAGSVPAWWNQALAEAPQRRSRRRRKDRVVLAAMLVCMFLALLPITLLLVDAVQGGGAELLRPEFYTSALPVACNPGCPEGYQLGGIGPAIQGTLLLLGLASLVALPVGILAGIYLSEYRGRWVGGLLSFLAEVMTGVPTILLGLLAVVFFRTFAPNYQVGLISGGLALGAVMFPIIARATQEALRSVPQSVREAALALGFPRHRVVLRVVLGSARNAVVTGVLLSLSRAAGDTAAILLTAGYSTLFFLGVDKPVAALPLYVYFGLGPYSNWQEAAWGAALVLLLIMFGISLFARLVTRGKAPTSEVV